MAALLAPRRTAAVLLALLAAGAAADQFLEGRRATLLRELQESLKGGRRRVPTEDRVAQLEGALRPTFVALPKVGATLSAASARYALHRLFLQLHGWQIKGLEASGQAWNELSLDDNVGRLMPERLRDLFDDRLAQGVNLHELAALAAALEHLIHGESEARLSAVYAAADVPMFDTFLTQSQADDMVGDFMLTFLRGVNQMNITAAKIQNLHSKARKLFQTWNDTLAFLRDVRAIALPGKTDNFSFEDVEAVVEEVLERYGRWQNFECGDMAQHLVSLEDHEGSGRVRLVDFYASTLKNGTYFLKESIPFLRELGALDEADPSNPRVIIPNYVLAPSNCLAPMTYYAVCCLSACEEILSGFERELGTSTASPASILRLVAGVPNQRSLSSTQVERLHDVANFHDGNIPLHGRLFAQWMHHAFPRDCPYPHLAGETKPRRNVEYRAQTGLKHVLTSAQLRQYVEQHEHMARPAADGPMTTPWVTQEELVDPVAHSRRSGLRAVGRIVLQLLALAALASATWSAWVVLRDDDGTGATKRAGSPKRIRGPKVHDV